MKYSGTPQVNFRRWGEAAEEVSSSLNTALSRVCRSLGISSYFIDYRRMSVEFLRSFTRRRVTNKDVREIVTGLM